MALGEIYVKLVVGFPRDPKVRALVRYGEDAGLARDLYVQMLLYCQEQLSDGWVPAEEIGVLAYPVAVDRAEQLAKQLASVGLIKESSKDDSQGWQVLAWLKRNHSKQDVEALSRKRAEAGRAGGRKSRPGEKSAGHQPEEASSKQVAKQNGSRPDPYTDTDTDTDQDHHAGDASPARRDAHLEPVREDVERICAYLADRIAGNGSSRPVVNKRWRDAARLMLERDGRTEEQILRAIDWCQDDEFWRCNILSMPKLRAQWDQLRLQARRGVGRGSPASRQQETDAMFERAMQRARLREQAS